MFMKCTGGKKGVINTCIRLVIVTVAQVNVYVIVLNIIQAGER